MDLQMAKEIGKIEQKADAAHDRLDEFKESVKRIEDKLDKLFAHMNQSQGSTKVIYWLLGAIITLAAALVKVMVVK